MKKYLSLLVALPALVVAMDNELTSEEKKVISEKLLTTWPEWRTFLKENQQNVDKYWNTLGFKERISLNVLLLEKANENIRQQEIAYLFEDILKDIPETTDKK